jgi:L-threonylcarbamoyladenylate synthase
MIAEAMIAEAARLIISGGTVVYPTETLYGIGASAKNSAAVKKVFDIKRRPKTMPISVAVSSFRMLMEVAAIDPGDLEILDRLLPGPVTVLVKVRRSLPEVLTAGSSRVGIRYPDHNLALRLIDLAGPITSTSANLTGSPPPVSFEEIEPLIAKSVDMVIDGGRCRIGEASTVFDLESKKIIRRGAGIDKVLELI